MDKYYTPTIEEFHVGFEYELTGGARNFKEGDEVMEYSAAWKPEVYTGNRNLSVLESILRHECARVKYLDQEDIESLGFEYKGRTGIGEKLDFFNRKQFKSKNHTLQWLEKGCVMISSNNNDLEDELKGYPDRLRFEGTIKNKSELKKVLKMIGYEPGS